MPGQHDDVGDELDPPGAPGDLGQQLGVVGDHGEAGEVVLDAHQGVKVQRLDQIDEREFVVVNLVVGAVAAAGLIMVTLAPTFIRTPPR